MTPARRARKRSGRRTRRSRPNRVRVAVLAVAIAGLVALGVNISVDATGDVTSTADLPAWTGERVRVEVLNAGEVPGAAREATEHLRSVGFDVVTFGNARTFDHDRPSSVVDRVGRSDLAGAVAAALGIDNVQSDPDPNLYVDVTVVLGRDWSGPGASIPEPGGSPPWWDPSGWFEG